MVHENERTAGVSDVAARFSPGRPMVGATATIFIEPSRQETEDDLTGRFG